MLDIDTFSLNVLFAAHRETLEPLAAFWVKHWSTEAKKAASGGIEDIAGGAEYKRKLKKWKKEYLGTTNPAIMRRAAVFYGLLKP